LTDPPACPRINVVRRFKLYIVIALVAFFVGVVSTTSGRLAVREATTFVREQFDDHCANNFFPC
jgi:hypothetical protein